MGHPTDEEFRARAILLDMHYRPELGYFMRFTGKNGFPKKVERYDAITMEPLTQKEKDNRAAIQETTKKEIWYD